MNYYRNYRRPYYRRQSHSFSNRNLGMAFLALLIVVVFENIKELLVSPLFYIFLAMGVYFVVRKIWRREKLKEFQVDDGVHADINSEKHGCKCYMEGLSVGEQEVAQLLARELSYKDYFLFNNLILPSENNGSTQVDHVVVSKYGVFIIESKDYRGWIFGDKDQATWTQSLPGGKNKFQFQNPIHQNYAHIVALKTLLPAVGDKLHGIVVFTNKSEFKTLTIDSVVNLSELVGYIKKFTQEVISESDLQLAIGQLSYLCQTIDITVAEHVANLHANRK